MKSTSPRVRVLVVDADADDLVLWCDALEQSDVEVDITSASDTDSARRLMSERTYDTYLIDWRLGRQSGMDLILDMSGAVTGPMIAVTGSHDPSVDRSAQAARAFDYLPKELEYSPEVMSRTIRYARHSWSK